jgi:hypothetical protein
LQTNTISASRDVSNWPDDERESDSVTISPLGNYFVVQMDKYCDNGQLGTDADPCGLMVYDSSLANGRGLLRIVGHSDMALDTNGKEVMVFQDIDHDEVSVLDLETGNIIPLFPIDFSFCDGCGMHFSGLGYQQPGWVLISYYDGDPVSHWWLDDQVVAVELKTDGRIVHLAHHHSLVDPDMEQDYEAEPHAAVNLDFTRILFTTNWGRSGTTETDMFMVQLPAGWIDQLP